MSSTPWRQRLTFQHSDWPWKWIVLGVVVAYLPRLTSLEALGNTFSHNTISSLGVTLGAFVFILCFPYATRSIRKTGEDSPPVPLRFFREAGIATLSTVAVLFCLGVANTALSRISPDVTLEPDMSREIVHAVGRWRTNLWLVLSFTLAPVAEEVFFRGFLQNALGRRMRFGLALAIQVSLFTLIHDYHSLGLAAVAFIGFVLTLLYRWRGTLLTPILTHAGINLFFSLAIVATSLAFSSAPVIGISTSGEPNSVVVKEVLPGSGAEAAGIQTGDRITHVDNKPVRSLHELKAVLIPFRPGDWVVLTVKRDGDILYTSVELTAPKLE